MLSNSVEDLHLHLVVDSYAEADLFLQEIPGFDVPKSSAVEIIAKEDVSEMLEQRFPGMKGLKALHDGHPCWRKIIDPLVLSQPGEEIIVADPDLIFPNRYRFEQTPHDGIMLMRQGPNCLYPPDAVREMFELGEKLANHVDIGVAQLRTGTVDMGWLNDVASKLDLLKYRPFMHIEAILWSAMAMRFGGRHLAPEYWRCWQRGYLKRLAVAAGLPGEWTLKLEPIKRVKCIHVSGPSKWWMKSSVEAGILKETKIDITENSVGPEYRELSIGDFDREQKFKEFLKNIGFYRLFT